MPRNITPLALLALAALGHSQSGAPPCHKGHIAQDYKMTEMPPPPLMTGLGDSHLAITTKSKQAQAYFDQGLRLLHCFWDFEAYRAFKEASRLDPDAAMPYWGIVESVNDYKAMSDIKDAALEKAKALAPKASDHEQFYIRAQQLDQKEDGHDNASAEMEKLIDKYPDDTDARLLLAIHSSYGYKSDGAPRKGTLYVQLLIRDILRNHPDSAAAHHYLIHALEASRHAQDAVPDADALARLAPSSGHMVHMPGHIYYRIGEYDRARESFLASKKVDEDYMRRERVGPVDDWNYPHNLSYLIASDAESGRYKEALDTAATLANLPANPFLARGSAMHVMTVGGSALRLNLRYGNWQAVIDRPIDVGMDEASAGRSAVAYRDGTLAYAKGMQAVFNNDAPSAARAADALDAISWRLHADKTGANDNEKDDDAKDADDGDDRSEGALKLLEMLSLDLRANLKGLEGNTAEAVALLKQALKQEDEIGYGEPPRYARPEQESLGYIYLRAHQWDQARDAFREALTLRPNSGHELYGIALSYELAGNKAEAARAYREFLTAWKSADPDLPMVKHAQSQSH